MRCEDLPRHPDFRALSSIGGLAVDLRYASSRNFVGRDLHGGLDAAWLHRTAANALERAVAALAQQAPGCRLLVLDALRPQRVQQMLWACVVGTDQQQYIADPALGSIHSFGMAVDLTVVDAAGRELDMGAGFDEMTDRSHPALEATLLACGALTERQVAHRALLRQAMAAGGFTGIDNEWWHFDAADPATVRSTFARID